jgi:hypothetical protein
MMAELENIFDPVRVLSQSKEHMEALLRDDNQQQRQRTYDAISVKLNDMEVCERKMVNIMGGSGTL